MQGKKLTQDLLSGKIALKEGKFQLQEDDRTAKLLALAKKTYTIVPAGRKDQDEDWTNEITHIVKKNGRKMASISDQGDGRYKLATSNTIAYKNSFDEILIFLGARDADIKKQLKESIRTMSQF